METNIHSHDGDAASLPPADTLLWEALPHLQLNIAQTAALCGISVRQLGYWTKQGYVTASGRGARRLYGLESLRRVLAIRNSMSNGASLRQALKGQSEPAAQPISSSIPEKSAATEANGTHFISPQDASALAADLLALFAVNRNTRDDAFGLAVKVGRSPSDILGVAELLCTQGVLRKTYSHNSAVFQRVGEDGV